MLGSAVCSRRIVLLPSVGNSPLFSRCFQCSLTIVGGFVFDRFNSNLPKFRSLTTFRDSLSTSDYIDHSTIMTTVPDWAQVHFKYLTYLQVSNFSMLELTGGKYGHLINDTLLKNPDFELSCFINSTPDLVTAEAQAANERTSECTLEKFLNLLSPNTRRTFETHIITLVNVGKECCGHKGIWHGGVISALFDNMLGLLGGLFLRVAATKSLVINFRRPVMVGETCCLVVSYSPEPSTSPLARFTAKGSLFNRKGEEAVLGESELVDVMDKWDAKPQEQE